MMAPSRACTLAQLLAAATVVVAVILALAAQESSAFKELLKKKYASKDKFAQWVGQKKKKPTYFQKHQAGGSVSKAKFAVVPQEDKEEGRRICQALEEESLPDFFMKFGLVTSLIEDVGAFKRQMKVQGGGMAADAGRKKRLDPLLLRKWKKEKKGRRREDEGGDRYFFREKAGLRPKPVKHNHLYGKFRARDDREYMPPCYGFNYLTAIDALMAAEAGGHPVPDPMELRDMLADVQDMRLSTLLAGIVDTCADKDGKEEEDGAAKSCPKLTKKPLLKLPADCVERCISNSDCEGRELCCDTSCGGRICFDPAAKPAKYRMGRGAEKCRPADDYLQCVYEKTKRSRGRCAHMTTKDNIFKPPPM